jgi:hypothetical protein
VFARLCHPKLLILLAKGTKVVSFLSDLFRTRSDFIQNLLGIEQELPNLLFVDFRFRLVTALKRKFGLALRGILELAILHAVN